MSAVQSGTAYMYDVNVILERIYMNMSAVQSGTAYMYDVNVILERISYELVVAS